MWLAPEAIMKQFCLGLLLSLGATPALYAQPIETPSNPSILYLQQLDVAIREGRLTQAEQMIALLEQSGPGPHADDLALLKAEFSIARMDVTSAGLALAAIKYPERNICRVHAAKGWVYANQQAQDEAIVALATATKNCPDDAGAWNLLGLAFINKGEASAASEAFQQALALNPGNAQVINNYAVAALQEGAVDVALRELNSAVIRSPQDGTIRANRNFVAGMAGLSPERVNGESEADWSAKLLQFAKGAKSASRGPEATALFSRAILTLERFDDAVWSEVNPENEGVR